MFRKLQPSPRHMPRWSFRRSKIELMIVTVTAPACEDIPFLNVLNLIGEYEPLFEVSPFLFFLLKFFDLF
jgi:hypothetical protein